MKPPTRPDHDELLGLAARLRLVSGSSAGSIECEVASLGLLGALAAHLDDERAEMARLAPGTTRMLLRGQRRLIELAIEAALASQHLSPRPCAELADELLARLSLQADDERRALPPDSATPASR